MRSKKIFNILKLKGFKNIQLDNIIESKRTSGSDKIKPSLLKTFIIFSE